MLRIKITPQNSNMVKICEALNIGFRMVSSYLNMAVCQNLVPLVNIKIAGKWMFIPLKMELIGIDHTHI